MKITEDYKNNIKEIEKFLHTFNFPKESEDKIRKYLDNPLDILNDDIKALFKKYDEQIVDYRIQLPTSMIRERRAAQKEIFLIMSIIVDCLEEDDQFKYSVDENGNIIPDFQITSSTISNNYFKIKNDKRKVWRYLDSKVTNIAKRIYERWYDKKTFNWESENENVHEYIDLKSNVLKLGPFYNIFDTYAKSLGSRSTSLKTKITKFMGKNQFIDVTGKSHAEIINIIADEILKPVFNITQEIISAKMLDLEKYRLFLSFNAFDWLLASTGEDWHSCIDMQSSYAYGTGLLGMCACPDWGMLLYTDGTGKEFGGIKSYHIITRSWICYTNQKDFQVVNWYPKDVRSTIEFGESYDFKFCFTRNVSSRRSMSEWEPITFENGAVAWIYSDSPRFTTSPNREKVYFTFGDSCGLPRLAKVKDKIVADSCCSMETVVHAISRKGFSSIWDAVKNNYKINVKPYREEECTCGICGSHFDNGDELTYIENEGIYVCNSCLTNNFFVCDRCGTYHRYEGDAIELRTGREAWDYEMVCRSCIDDGMNNDTIYYDEHNNNYYAGDDYYIVHLSDNIDMTVSPYSIDSMLREGSIFRHVEDGEYYDYAEEPRPATEREAE